MDYSIFIYDTRKLVYSMLFRMYECGPIGVLREFLLLIVNQLQLGFTQAPEWSGAVFVLCY